MPEVIELKCNSCGAMLNYDEDHEIMFCPYCGSKNLIVVSDSVKIEKIKSNKEVEINKIDANKELEDLKIRTDYSIKSEKLTLIGFAGLMLFFFIMLFIFS